MDARYLERFLSDTARGATRSEIRELLKLMSRPEIISLAGGMPSPDTFPLDELTERVGFALRAEGRTALQYGTTEGDPALKQAILRFLVETEGTPFSAHTPEHLLVTSASQQSLDLCARTFLSPYDAVMVELPSYLGALAAFRTAGARAIGVPADGDGLCTDRLEERLVDARRRGIHPKLVYVVPDFANPTGETMSRTRRLELLSIARDFDLLVIEDTPYRLLRYAGEAQPTLASLDRDGRVISLHSLSKILAPGIRVGWIVAHPEIVSRLVVTKQAVDLCTGGLSQLVARVVLEGGELLRHLECARSHYAWQRDRLVCALERELDPAWGVRFTRPEGGFFAWLALPSWMDARVLLERALVEHKVAFVAGDAFHADGSGRNTLRLSFGCVSPSRLEEAVARLARAIGELWATGEGRSVEAVPRAALEGLDRDAWLQTAWHLCSAETSD
jgi:2-aminoadipate transaminase